MGATFAIGGGPLVIANQSAGIGTGSGGGSVTIPSLDRFDSFTSYFSQTVSSVGPFTYTGTETIDVLVTWLLGITIQTQRDTYAWFGIRLIGDTIPKGFIGVDLNVPALRRLQVAGSASLRLSTGDQIWLGARIDPNGEDLDVDQIGYHEAELCISAL